MNRGLRLNTTLIKAQLDKLLASRRFADGNRHRDLLTYVVEETLAGRSNRLKAYNIATQAFGYPDDYDPQSNPTVRVAAHRLRSQLRFYYAEEGQQDEIIISIPKGGYVPVFETSHQASPGSLTRLPIGDTSYGLPVIVVCPIEIISLSSQIRQLSCGLEQELVQALTRFEEIAVLPQEAAGRAKGNSGSPQEIGRRAGADFVVSWALQSASRSARLYVRLIGQHSGHIIWANSYDLNLAETSDPDQHRTTAVEIAGAIAQPFGHAHIDRSWSSRIRSVTDLNVYECLLQAHIFNENMSEDNFNRGITAARRAIELAPTNPAAWATLSEMQTESYLEGFGNWQQADRLLEEARYCANRACELNPESGRANLAMSTLHYACGETGEMIRRGDQAIACNPGNSAIAAMYGTYRAYSGDWGNGLGLIQDAIDRQSMHPTWYLYPFMDNAYRIGNFDESLRISGILRLEDFHVHYINLTMKHSLLGQHDLADRAYNTLLDRWPEHDMEGMKELWRRNYPKDLLELNFEGLKASRIAA